MTALGKLEWPHWDNGNYCSRTRIRVGDFRFGNWDLDDSSAGNWNLGQI